MSLNKEYATLMGNGVDTLVENHNYNKATNHVSFDSSKVVLPKGVTTDSLQTHVEFINNTSGQVRGAVAVIGRNEFENNKKLTTIDGTLEIGGVVFNSQHHLKQQIGDETFLYGPSTTAVSYAHSQDHADWMVDQDKTNVEMATKLFG